MNKIDVLNRCTIDGYVVKLPNILIRILQEEFKDKTAHSWIEYYCYELDFGAENWRLKAYDENKKEIPLSNAEQLYNLLISKL